MAGLFGKRLDGLAINWGHRTVLILELIPALDSRVDWHILVDQHKAERYTSLRNRLHVSGQVEIMPFCLSRSCPSRWTSPATPSEKGHTPRDADRPWTAALSRFGLKAVDLLTGSTESCRPAVTMP